MRTVGGQAINTVSDLFFFNLLKLINTTQALLSTKNYLSHQAWEVLEQLGSRSCPASTAKYGRLARRTPGEPAAAWSYGKLCISQVSNTQLKVTLSEPTWLRVMMTLTLF